MKDAQKMTCVVESLVMILSRRLDRRWFAFPAVSRERAFVDSSAYPALHSLEQVRNGHVET